MRVVRREDRPRRRGQDGVVRLGGLVRVVGQDRQDDRRASGWPDDREVVAGAVPARGARLVADHPALRGPGADRVRARRARRQPADVRRAHRRVERVAEGVRRQPLGQSARRGGPGRVARREPVELRLGGVDPGRGVAARRERRLQGGRAAEVPEQDVERPVVALGHGGRAQRGDRQLGAGRVTGHGGVPDVGHVVRGDRQRLVEHRRRAARQHLAGGERLERRRVAEPLVRPVRHRGAGAGVAGVDADAAAGGLLQRGEVGRDGGGEVGGCRRRRRGARSRGRRGRGRPRAGSPGRARREPRRERRRQRERHRAGRRPALSAHPAATARSPRVRPRPAGPRRGHPRPGRPGGADRGPSPRRRRTGAP